MNKSALWLLMGMAILNIVGCYEDNAPSIYDQVGYHKHDKNRIFSIVIDADAVSAEQVLDHALSLPHTQGRLTRALFFLDRDRALGDQLTVSKYAGNLVEQYVEHADFFFVRGTSGEYQFADCRVEPAKKDAICSR